MIEWKRLYAKPAGSLPGGVVTQWGVGAITVFILLFLTYWIFFEGGKPAEVAGSHYHWREAGGGCRINRR